MNKIIFNGRVAVLVSHGWGAGWYSWHGVEELLYDPIVVELVRKADFEKVDLSDEIIQYCEKKYGDDIYFGGIDGLTIEWVPVGEKFRINEYDGAESLELHRDGYWMIA